MAKILGNPTSNNYARIPIVPLSYNDRNKAIPRELLVDYSNGTIYIVSEDGSTLYNVTSNIAAELQRLGIEIDSSNITVEITGTDGTVDVIEDTIEHKYS